MAFCNSSSSSPNSSQSGDGHQLFPLAITKESLLAAQMADVHKIMDLFVIKESQAGTLLRHHRWNLERIFAQFESKGKERLFSEARISVNCNKDNGLLNLKKLSKSGFLCNICFEGRELSCFTAMDCGHCFCNSCWIEHFITSINNNQAKQIRCMSITCPIICDQNTVYHLTLKKDKEAADRFARFLMESYITDNDSIKFCPSTPPCGRAIQIRSTSDPFREVECLCGTRFCFNCLAKPHSPCPCRMWAVWVERTKGLELESRSLDWIANNAKVCPRCRMAVMKVGGCHLMTCTCNQRFCWLCDQALGPSEVHTCTPKSEDPKIKPNRNPNRFPSSDKSKLSRYFERYRSHCSLLQKETASYSLVLEKCPSLPTVILAGFETLINSRRALSHTYPFAFFMFGDELANNNLTNREIRRDLFEDQQRQLEICVERLAMEVENFCDQTGPGEIAELARCQVVIFSELVDKRCKDMYDCIQDELLPNFGVIEFIAPYMPLQGCAKAKELPNRNSLVGDSGSIENNEI